MSYKIPRLIRIINLIQNSPGIKAKELAEKCEVSDRTIYRDINDILVARIPIMKNDGRGKGYSFIGNFAMYPLDWTTEEAMAFSLLPGVVRQNLIQTTPHFQTAYEKIMAAYNKEQSNQQQNISKLVALIQSGKPQNKVGTSNKFLLPIAESMVRNQTLKVKYETKSRDDINDRFIDPYYLIPRESKFYLLAYCHEREDFRTFRLSRFLKVEATNRIFTKRQLDLQKYYQNTWSIIKGDKEIYFKVLFNKNVARYVKEKELFATPKLTKYEDGSLLFEITLNHEEEFLKWVRQYGPDAEIIEPVEYRERMQEELRKWAEMYKKSDQTLIP